MRNRTSYWGLIWPVLLLAVGNVSIASGGAILDLNTTPEFVGSGVFDGTVVAVATDSASNVFVLTNNKLIHLGANTSAPHSIAILHSVALGISPDLPVAMVTDSNGNIYIATQSGTLLRYTFPALTESELSIPTSQSVGEPLVALTLEDNGTGMIVLFPAARSGHIYSYSQNLVRLPGTSTLLRGAPIAIAFDNSDPHLIVATTAGMVYCLSVGLGTVASGNIPSLGSPVAVAFDGAGTTIVATETELVSINIVGGMIVPAHRLVPSGLVGNLVGVAFAENGGVCVTVSQSGTIYFFSSALAPLRSCSIGLPCPHTGATCITCENRLGCVGGIAVGPDPDRAIYVVGASATATLTVSGASSSPHDSVTFSDMMWKFPDTAAGSTSSSTLTLELTNNGPGPVEGLSASSTSTTSTPTPFPIISAPSTSLAEAESTGMTIGFNEPAGGGPQTATITVSYKSCGANDPFVTAVVSGKSPFVLSTATKLAIVALLLATSFLWLRLRSPLRPIRAPLPP